MPERIKKCKIDGCTGQGELKYKGRRYFTKGLCKGHYQKLWRYGTTTKMPSKTEMWKMIHAKSLD